MLQQKTTILKKTKSDTMKTKTVDNNVLEWFKLDQQIHHNIMNTWFNKLCGFKCNCVFCKVKNGEKL